jgi:transposase InsO family protein
VLVDVAWCGDVTWIPTDEGWLYLASVIDLASRHLLGWSMGAHHDAALVCDALGAAQAGCRRHPGELASHPPQSSMVHRSPTSHRSPVVRHCNQASLRAADTCPGR